MRFSEYYAKSARIKKPGSRGGHGYYDEHGEWVYGDRPITVSSDRRVRDLLGLMQAVLPGLSQALKARGLRITTVPGSYVPDSTGSTERGDWAHVTPGTGAMVIAARRIGVLPHEVFHVLDGGTIKSVEDLRWRGGGFKMTEVQKAAARLTDVLWDSPTWQAALKDMDDGRATVLNQPHELAARFFQSWLYHKMGLPEPKQPKDQEHWTVQDFATYGPLLETLLTHLGATTPE